MQAFSLRWDLENAYGSSGNHAQAISIFALLVDPLERRVDLEHEAGPGRYPMDSASTGNSTDPHLHFAIRFDGMARCPQPFLVAIARGQSVAPAGQLRTGCTS